MRGLRCLVGVVGVLGLLAPGATAGPKPRRIGAHPITGLVAFGDSLTDTGNLFAATHATFPPSPPYFAGRFSNGPVWVEGLAGALGLPGPTPSLSGGTDCAWGGAETGVTGVSNRGTPNLGTQIAGYLVDHPRLDAHQLLVLWGGANDFLNSGQTDPAVPVSNLAHAITTLAAAGGTLFLVPNLPPLGRTPRYVGTDQEDVFDALSRTFNAQLAARLKALEADLKITILRLDMYELTAIILDHPAWFGLVNVTGTALNVPGGGVGDGIVVAHPDTYAFWDDVHPTRVTHEIWGTMAAAAVVFQLRSRSSWRSRRRSSRRKAVPETKGPSNSAQSVGATAPAVVCLLAP